MSVIMIFTFNPKRFAPKPPTMIEVFPPEIVLKNIEVDQLYEVTVSVRNLSKHVRRIRFVPPKASKFLAEYKTLGAIAGGVSTNITVTFETDSLGHFHDELQVISEELKVVIPLHAYAPMSDIKFDPFLKLGFTPEGRHVRKELVFVNEGETTGSVSLTWRKDLSPELQVEPEEFKIEPRDSRRVVFTYRPKEIGVFRCLVEVEVKGFDQIRHIDVNSICVEQQVSIVAPALHSSHDSTAVAVSDMAVTTNINFGSIYHGQSKTVEAHLFNNGPIKLDFAIKVFQGTEEDAENEIYLTNTPQEVAEQEFRRVMMAEPESGVVEPYSHVVLKFTCHSKLVERLKGFIHNLMEDHGRDAISSEVVDNALDYFYTAIFTFPQLEQRINLQLQARAVLPSLQLSSTGFHFPPCEVKDRRDLMMNMTNLNDELPIDFTFDKVSQFSITPHKGYILPLQAIALTVTFSPHNIGVFDLGVMLKLVSQVYSVPLKLFGKSFSKSTPGVSKETWAKDNHIKPRGPGATVTDFIEEPRFVEVSDMPIPELEQSRDDFLGQVDQALMSQRSKRQPVDFLKESRNRRRDTERSELHAKTLQSIPKSEQGEFVDLDTRGPKLKEPLLELPSAKDGLHVHTIALSDKYASQELHDPDAFPKNLKYKVVKKAQKWTLKPVPLSLYPSKPLEVSECSEFLTADDLRLISCGPKVLNFGSIVVNNSSSKCFSVISELQKSLFVELVCNTPEIQSIEPSSLVIPPFKKGGFKVTVKSSKKQRLSQTVSYIFNHTQTFNFLIQADIEPAVMKLSKSSLVFEFEEDNMDASLVEKIVIENECGAATHFNWKVPADSNFKVEPSEGLVDPRGTFVVFVRYTPAVIKLDSHEEVLGMSVENGEKLELRCKGIVAEAKCTFLQKTLDFAVVAVGLKQEKSVTLKNHLPSVAIFHIKRFPEQLKITPMKGRISGDGKSNIKIEFISTEPLTLVSDIEVQIRGGKSLTLAVRAQAIVPNVYVKEHEIDFGGVTCGNQAVTRFHIMNDSVIPAHIYLNLEEHPEFEICLPVGEEEIDASALAPAATDKENPFVLPEEAEMAELKMDPAMAEEDEEEFEEEIVRVFKITVNPNSILPLLLKLTPADTESYSFDMPFLVAGSNEPIPDLCRPVIGEGLKPRFLVKPTTLDFQKKVVSVNEKSFASYREIVLSNPDIVSVHWRIETASLNRTQIFAVKPHSEGDLDPGDSFSVRVSFNPTKDIEYEEVVELFLDEVEEPYLTLTLKGEGTVPRITFDRREVILPIVPVGFQARAQFQIYNSGYENVDLTFILPTEEGSIPLELIFPEGTSLGVTKQRIPVEAVFTSKKPLSFTAKIDFLDNTQSRFSIPISGTTDNSLFTIFPFIQRYMDEIHLEAEEGRPITLVLDATSDMEENSIKIGGGGPRTSAASSVVSRSARSIIGYNPIPMYMLDKGLEFMTRFLNNRILSTTISRFPDDFITAHGAQLYELIIFLGGKSPPGQLKNPNSIPPKEQVKMLLKQYEALLHFLKQHGALLNTIRPEYLLSKADYIKYLKSTPLQLQLRPQQIDRRWSYMSKDAWTVLIYQVFKIYGLSRINPKSFKSLPGIPSERAVVDGLMAESNVYSMAENILLKWLSYHFANMNPHGARPITNFDSDLADGTVLAAVIQSHVGPLKSLAGLKSTVTTEEHKLSNCERVLNAFSEIGAPTFVTAAEIARMPSPREMLMLTMIAFTTLPHYVPKCVIEFPCMLGEKVTKTIDLTNPTSKPITYRVIIDGSRKYFSLDEDKELIAIQPKETVSFPVHFQSRLSTPVQAKLSFTSRTQEGSAPAAALVFELISRITSRRSEQTIEVETLLYELLSKDMDVVNPFPEDAEFTVKIEYVQVQPPVNPKAKKQRVERLPSTIQFPPPFFLKDKLKVKRSGTNYITLQYLPFELATRTANISFIDERVGEFQYTVIGTVIPPKPDKGDKYDVKAELGDTVVIDVPLASRNSQFEKAKAYAIDRLSGSHRNKEKEELKEMLRRMQDDDTSTFEVSINSPYFSGPPTIQIVNIGAGASKRNIRTPRSTTSQLENSTKEGGKSLAPEKANRLTLNCSPRNAGDYYAQVLLRSLKGTDIRCIEVTASIKPKPTKLTLEMTTQARQSVSQEIPIINTSVKDWQVKVTFTQDSELFSAGKDFTVRRGTTYNYTITFNPEWTCETNARLLLEVVQTSELHDFMIKGVAEEPCAEDNIVVESRVKQTSHHMIPVPNPRDVPVTYRVESDLLHAVGDSVIIVPGKSIGKYDLVMYPLQSGAYTGSITFYDPAGRFYWYTVEVKSQEPEPEDQKTLEVVIRQAVELKITVYNPLAESTVFEVSIVGDGLVGDSSFIVPAKEVGVYELMYSPLKIGEFDGAVSFMSERTGEFWYRLKLIAREPEPIEMELFEAELGRYCMKTVLLENPSPDEVVLDYQNSNPVNFELIPEKIVLQPYEVFEVKVKYSPSTLKYIDNGEIKLLSQGIGDWHFLLKGRGLPPDEMEPILMAASMGENSSVQVPFKNPFRDTVQVNVELEGPEEFQLLVKRKKFTITPLGLLLLPIAFRPAKMQEYEGSLFVWITEELKWRYPLKGITERGSRKTDFTFKAKCRESIEKNIDVPLDDVRTEEENYTHEINVLQTDIASLVRKSFSIEPLRTILIEPDAPFQFHIRFAPLRPFKANVELLIYKSSGGRWKFNVALEATEPEVDDVINIESPLHKIANVAFRLTNQFKSYADFEAFLTPESDPCFAVTPSRGVLEPHGRDGSQFVVSFRPTEYGAPKVGKLVIQTADMQWSYVVRGSHPTYKAPEVAGGRLDNKLQRQTQDQVKKNYIRANMKTTSPIRISPKPSKKSLSKAQ
jgi:hypothetical protein